MTGKNRVRRRRCKDNLRVLIRETGRMPFVDMRLLGRGPIKISWFYRIQKQWGIHMETTGTQAVGFMFGVTSTVTAEIIRLDLPKKDIHLILLQNLGIAKFDKSFSSS